MERLRKKDAEAGVVETKLTDEQYVWLDRFTIRNLELIYSPHQGGKTLLVVLDQTSSPMGARLMKRWIVTPLLDRANIAERLGAVERRR